MTMSFMRDRPAAPPPGPVFAELATVALIRNLPLDGGSLPAGTRGTVVAVYRGNLAYEVEFDRPFHAIVTLTPADLTA